MNNQQIRNLAFWIMLIAVIALGVYAFYWIRSTSFECVSNPYVYSIKLLEEANSATVSCVCTSYKANGGSVLLTRDGFSPVVMEQEEGEINGSEYINEFQKDFQEFMQNYTVKGG